MKWKKVKVGIRVADTTAGVWGSFDDCRNGCVQRETCCAHFVIVRVVHVLI